MKDSHDVGPVCSRFVQGDDMVVAEHYDYDSVSIICLCMVSLPGPWGSRLLSGDTMYGASSVHCVQINNKRSFEYTSHTISLLLNTHNSTRSSGISNIG